MSVLAFPESLATPIHGLYETLEILEAVANSGNEAGGRLFEVELVGAETGVVSGACGLPLRIHRSVSEVEHTDIVLMTSMLFGDEWIPGRHPEIVDWLLEMHGRGTSLCSACAGALLLAETGLLDGREATTHWAFAPTFEKNFPEVTLRIDELLVTAGDNQEFVMSGAASSWQDLVLFLIARHYSPAAAQAVGKFLLFPWHEEAQTPYVSFSPPSDHADAVIRSAQAWVHESFRVSSPVDEMVQRSGLSESSFKRRFKHATGLSPLHYVQHVRIEEAKRLFEGTGQPIDEICWTIGYEDPAFFRRLFRRLTSLTPSQYRKKFRLPSYARELG